VKEIWTLDGPLHEAFSPQSVTLVLEHDIDVSRGDIIVDPNDLPGASAELHAKVCCSFRPSRWPNRSTRISRFDAFPARKHGARKVFRAIGDDADVWHQ